MIKRPSLNGSRLQSVRCRKQTVGGYFKLWQDLLIFAELCEYFENCANIGRSIQRPQPNIATAWFCKIQHRCSSRCMEGTIWIIMNLILWNSTPIILIDLNMILQNIFVFSEPAKILCNLIYRIFLFRFTQIKFVPSLQKPCIFWILDSVLKFWFFRIQHQFSSRCIAQMRHSWVLGISMSWLRFQTWFDKRICWPGLPR